MLRIIEANRFHWNTNTLSKLCKCFNILKIDSTIRLFQLIFDFFPLSHLIAMIVIPIHYNEFHVNTQEKHLHPAKSICLHWSTKIAAGYNYQGISSHYMDLCLERCSMKTVLWSEETDPFAIQGHAKKNNGY